MRLRFTAFLLFIITTTIISCKKDETTPDDQPEQTASALFVRLQQGLTPDDDTVYLLKYDAEKRIKSIEDSTYGGSLSVTYDAKGNMTAITDVYEEYSYTTDFTYNSDNQLTEVYLKNEPARYTFEYTNGIISKKNYYAKTNLNNPALNLWRSYTYEVKDGNISSMKEYDGVGTLIAETVYTYTSEPNVFKPISLINFTNYVGLFDLANEDYVFNKNLIATATTGDAKTTYTYTYNDKKQLTKVVSTSPRETLTRILAY